MSTKTFSWLRSLVFTHYHPTTRASSSSLPKSFSCSGLGARPQILVDNAISDVDRAELLTVKADDGSEWIFALPFSARGLRISNEAVRIANLRPW